MLFVPDTVDDIFVGSDFDVPIQIENKSAEQRTVNITVTLSSVYYTGVTRSKLKQAIFSQTFAPGSSMLKKSLILKFYIHYKGTISNKIDLAFSLFGNS